MKKNKSKITIKKLPWKTKMRYLFLGKYPLERRYLPKVLEYLILVFANTVMLISQILLFFYVIKIDANSKITVDTKILMEYHWRIVLAIIILSYLVIVFMSLHICSILSKTEFNKWIGIVSMLASLLFLSPIGMLFAMVAYVKNEIVFE
ncbi:hypothetical protein C4M97_01695 [Mycoplasmopsis pullorum]|uniref:hypothetical protein n=1 Tax=Mycoplasmopsis pullorum TaxID=48003 RepID=UPI0011194961|nr:hypothetical protein [Mycoplasmopsis pullorum]TNK81855.1 hypothetical protein C4M94_02775 [Mycoplasmopsis pullorum]TNK82584.1 hypothetical protein C4M80_02840 [Mycoplasmopsis pullorum]TNK84152.1 hypothetical protein C4M81_03105 [Mycoplasmopsis pullorum]TNK84722.1 hypothetical protein C4M92_02980 [Mycoplasmopsis pullorum]TNK85924.1 hypothetical protein C4M85_02025 [Mycoplasmopsis pullorum]